MRSVGIESIEHRHNPQITCRLACTAHGAIRTCERLRCVGGAVLVQVHGFLCVHMGQSDPIDSGGRRDRRDEHGW